MHLNGTVVVAEKSFRSWKRVDLVNFLVLSVMNEGSKIFPKRLVKNTNLCDRVNFIQLRGLCTGRKQAIKPVVRSGVVLPENSLGSLTPVASKFASAACSFQRVHRSRA